jgi:hypothetical protein
MQAITGWTQNNPFVAQILSDRLYLTPGCNLTSECLPAVFDPINSPITDNGFYRQQSNGSLSL